MQKQKDVYDQIMIITCIIIACLALAACIL
jgi:hypothetical protein